MWVWFQLSELFISLSYLLVWAQLGPGHLWRIWWRRIWWQQLGAYPLGTLGYAISLNCCNSKQKHSKFQLFDSLACFKCFLGNQPKCPNRGVACLSKFLLDRVISYTCRQWFWNHSLINSCVWFLTVEVHGLCLPPSPRCSSCSFTSGATDWGR